MKAFLKECIVAMTNNHTVLAHTLELFSLKESKVQMLLGGWVYFNCLQEFERT